MVTDTRLGGSDPVLTAACSCDGLFVNSGVTLQIRGTIRSENSFCSGIVLAPGATGVVVATGRIVGFETGVDAFAATKSQFSRLEIVDTIFDGIRLTGDDNVIENNVFLRPGFHGIDVDGDRNTVRLNRTEEGFDGLIVIGADNVIESNVTLGPEFSGILVVGDRNSVRLNRTEDGEGIGVVVLDGSGNVVSRNLARRNGREGFLIGGAGATVDRNRSQFNVDSGFSFEGVNHTVTLNIAEHNAFDGFSVAAEASAFNRNRSDYNGRPDIGVGIVDSTAGNGTGGTANLYTANRCTGNGTDASNPDGLCF